jgi:hypothetical protein
MCFQTISGFYRKLSGFIVYALSRDRLHFSLFSQECRAQTSLSTEKRKCDRQSVTVGIYIFVVVPIVVFSNHQSSSPSGETITIIHCIYIYIYVYIHDGGDIPGGIVAVVVKAVPATTLVFK